MKIHPTTPSQTPIWPRLLIGGMLILLGLTGVFWTTRVLIADYRFHNLERPETGQNSRDYLTNFAYQLEHLIWLDPSNGDIRNLYATVLGKIGMEFR